MFSCDTVVVYKDYSKYSSNMLAKNSDRPTAESQSLRFYPGQKHKSGEELKLTNISINNVEKTYSVVGSQPYWTWGFEMGYNEKNVVIANEAEGSKMGKESAEGILGLDLIRLALERASTARESVYVITSLLEKYGQDANASMLFDRRYENSFIIMDSEEIWLLDKAILLPENTTVILRNCKIKLSDKCRDNFFRTANCGLGIPDPAKTSNIHIKGEGLCVLEGAEHPRATGDGGKMLSKNCPYRSENEVFDFES